MYLDGIQLTGIRVICTFSCSLSNTLENRAGAAQHRRSCRRVVASQVLPYRVYLSGTWISFIVQFVPSLVPRGLWPALHCLLCILCLHLLDADDTLIVDRTHLYPVFTQCTTFDVYISITA